MAKHFLPFKTPLCKLYDEQIEKVYQFHPRDVFAHKFRGAEPGARIGLWIDLTKTNRYYSRKEVFGSTILINIVMLFKELFMRPLEAIQGEKT